MLDRSRRFGREQMVLIGVRVLSGVVSASQAGEAYATLADVLIRALHRATENRFAETYGRLAELANGRSRDRQTRRPRDDGGLRSRPPSPLRIRSGATRIEWRAQARRQPVLRPLHEASHQRAHDAAPTKASSTTSICAFGLPAARARSRPRSGVFPNISARKRGHGSTWRLPARGVVSAEPVFHGKIEALIARSALHETRSAQDRDRHPGDARADREG